MLRRFSPYVLAFFWLVYGRGHFLFRQEVERQIPPIIPFKSAIVTVTGVSEIVCAILLVPAATRTYGAWGTIVLLTLFVPAILYMVVADIFPESWSPRFRSTVRWLAIPHNIFFAIWAYYLAGPT